MSELVFPHGRPPVLERVFDLMESETRSSFLSGRIFCGKPASTPDQVRGRLFPENAPTASFRVAQSASVSLW
jgi:hypothetical protein